MRTNEHYLVNSEEYLYEFDHLEYIMAKCLKYDVIYSRKWLLLV